MKVLYANHTSILGGAERSLLTLLEALPDDVSPVLACPEGPLAEEARELGVPVHGVRGTEGSARLHPVHTPRLLAELSRDAVALRRLARRLGADLVHANSTRAALPLALSRRQEPPTVAHVRDCMPPGRASELTRRLIGRRAALVLSNSRYTQEQFLLPSARAAARVAYSPVDLTSFDPSSVPREEARAALGVEGDGVVLSVVAQITPWKGQDDAIRMLDLLRAGHPDARLLLAGSTRFVSAATRYDNRTFLRSLEDLVASRGLGDQVEFLGERSDVARVIRASDIVLVPSWEEPFGRSIVEAMAMGVPVAVTSVGGSAEIVRDGEEGLVLPPRRPEVWAEALSELMAGPDLRRQMGEKGKRRARDFGAEAHARTVVDAYRSLLGG